MKLLELIFPASCLNCGIYNTYLCDRCKGLLTASIPRCFICNKLSNNYTTHHQCKANNKYEYDLHNVTSLWQYNTLGSKIISEIKYKGVFRILPRLEECIDERFLQMDLIQLYSGRNTYLTYIPQHRSRTKERGFELTSILSKWVHKTLGIRQIEPNLIYKKYNNRKQASLKYESRYRNSKDLYETNNEILDQIEELSNIIIIDDVITSGSTLLSATQAIKRKRPDLVVSGLSLFRAYRKNYSTTSAS